MNLELGYLEIKEIVFGRKTGLEGALLTIDRQDLEEKLKSRDERIHSVGIHLTKPGESARIICVKDVVEPRYKVTGQEPGTGRMHILKNCAVVTCGKIVGFQEGIIDMSGPGADHTPFSRTFNVVLEIEVVLDLSPHDHEEVVRDAGLYAASLLADSAAKNIPDYIETYPALEESTQATGLPRVAYVYMLLSQGLLHDTYVLGRNAREGLPRILSPNILLEGAITSGNCVSACDKNTTYHHQNNPVLRELYRHHRKDLDFVGVVLTNEPISLAAKNASARGAVELVRQLDAEAAIISKEGFGNPDTDQILLIKGLEEAGILTVAITDEYAGVNGGSQSLADAHPLAKAMVSVGNANERIILPPQKRLIGPVGDLNRLAGSYPHSLHQDGSLEVELQAIIGSTNELGFQTLRCIEV